MSLPYYTPEIIRSLIAPKSLIKLVEDAYPLSVRDISLLSIGDNDHYLVETSATLFVLRIYRHKKHWLPSKEHHDFEIELMRFLYTQKLPISYPIQRSDSTYLSTLHAPEGLRQWALFSFIAGREMQFTAKNCYNYGQIISKMHSMTDHFKPASISLKTDISFLLELPLKRITTYAHCIHPKDLEYLHYIVLKLTNEIHRFHQQAPQHEWGIIGGDFHGGNHFVDEKDSITLFDFDLSGYGWRTYDIAVFKWALYNICRRAPKVRNREAFWNAFLNGYHQNRALNQTQLAMITTFIQARQIWLMGSETMYRDKILDAYYWKNMFEGLRAARHLK